MQQTSPKLLFSNVHRSKNVLLCSCCMSIWQIHMHHNYGVISGRHVCSDCVWLTIFGVGLHVICRGKQVLVVINFSGTFLPLRPYWEKLCICFLKAVIIGLSADLHFWKWIFEKHDGCHVESWTQNRSHSRHRLDCSTTMMVPLQWQTQHFIRTVSSPTDLQPLTFLKDVESLTTYGSL